MNTNIFESTSEVNDSDVVENKLDDFYYEKLSHSPYRR